MTVADDNQKPKKAYQTQIDLPPAVPSHADRSGSRSRLSAAVKAYLAELPRDAEGRPIMLDTADAARYLQVSKRTLEDWRLSGIGPVYAKFGHSVRYTLLDLDTFLYESRQTD